MFQQTREDSRAIRSPHHPPSPREKDPRSRARPRCQRGESDQRGARSKGSAGDQVCARAGREARTGVQDCGGGEDCTCADSRGGAQRTQGLGERVIPWLELNLEDILLV